MAHLVLNGESADGDRRYCERLVGRAFDYPGDPKELRSSLVPAFRHAFGDGDKLLKNDGLRLQKPSVAGVKIEHAVDTPVYAVASKRLTLKVAIEA